MRNRQFARQADVNKTLGLDALKSGRGYDRPLRFYFVTDPDWYKSLVQLRQMKAEGSMSREDALVQIKAAVLNHPEPLRQQVLSAFTYLRRLQPLTEWLG